MKSVQKVLQNIIKQKGCRSKCRRWDEINIHTRSRILECTTLHSNLVIFDEKHDKIHGIKVADYNSSKNYINLYYIDEYGNSQSYRAGDFDYLILKPANKKVDENNILVIPTIYAIDFNNPVSGVEWVKCKNNFLHCDRRRQKICTKFLYTQYTYYPYNSNNFITQMMTF